MVENQFCLRIGEFMDKYTKMSVAADLFMLQLIGVDNANATKLTLPKALLSIYKEVIDATGANVQLHEGEGDTFSLNFVNRDEQDKVWDALYSFNHSGYRTYEMPNVYDQDTGALLKNKLDTFVERAIADLNNKTPQVLFEFIFDDVAPKFNLTTLNQRLKDKVGHGVKYVLAVDTRKNLPINVMLEGGVDVQSIQLKFRDVVIEEARKVGFENILDEGHFFKIYFLYRFECDGDLDTWDQRAMNMKMI